MKNLTKTLAILLIALFSISLISCEKEPTPAIYYEFNFDSYSTDTLGIKHYNNIGIFEIDVDGIKTVIENQKKPRNLIYSVGFFEELNITFYHEQDTSLNYIPSAILNVDYNDGSSQNIYSKIYTDKNDEYITYTIRN